MTTKISSRRASRRALKAIAAIACLTCSAGFASAADNEAELELAVSAGWDSNPLDLPWDEESSAFTSIDLDAALTSSWSPAISGFARIDGTTRFFESDFSDADLVLADTALGIGWTPRINGRRNVSIAFGVSYAVFRAAYVDPATGDVAFVQTGGSSQEEIRDRFDFDGVGGFMDLRWRARPHLLAFLDVEYVERDFAEDYDELPTVEPLDESSLRFKPGIRWLVSYNVALDVTFEISRREYDDLRALDQGATPVDGSRREYGYVGARISVRLQPTNSLNLAFGLRGTERDDTFAGYYDYEATGLFASAGYGFGDRTRVRLSLSQRSIRYDQATIGNDPSLPLQENDTFRVLGRVERDLNERFTWFVEASAERADSRDPIYEYDRDWARSGVSFRL